MTPLLRAHPKLPIVAGAVACAACCAIPLLAPLLFPAGVGSAVLVWAATRSELLGLVCLVLGSAIVGFQWWRSRRALTAAASCATDGSCGCRPAASGERG